VEVSPPDDADRRRPRMARPRNARAGSPTHLLDDVGKAILRQLQEDGRRSYTAIAEAVGLSEAAVRQRVKALVDSGALQIVAVADPITLGFGVMASVGVTVAGDSRLAAEMISEIDLQLEIVCRDNEHLLSVINDRIRTIEGVRDTETSICLRVHKQTYNYGTN
jgi:Lrp/AsnC family transcriptional regulator, regulator for asnA, asnC and gidA